MDVRDQSLGEFLLRTPRNLVVAAIVTACGLAVAHPVGKQSELAGHLVRWGVPLTLLIILNLCQFASGGAGAPRLGHRLQRGDLVYGWRVEGPEGRLFSVYRGSQRGILNVVGAHPTTVQLKQQFPDLLTGTPQLIDVLDGSPDTKNPFLVTDAVGLRRLSPASMSDDRSLRAAAIDILSALTALHEAGIVHGSVEPSAFRSDVHGYYLGSFEHSCQEGDPASAFYSGRVGYQPPELDRQTPSTTKSDIFQWGCSFYELATENKAFPSKNWIHAWRQATDGIQPDFDDAPCWLRDALRSALEPDPALRPSAASLLSVLGADATDKEIPTRNAVRRRRVLPSWVNPFARFGLLALVAWAVVALSVTAHERSANEEGVAAADRPIVATADLTEPDSADAREVADPDSWSMSRLYEVIGEPVALGRALLERHDLTVDCVEVRGAAGEIVAARPVSADTVRLDVGSDPATVFIGTLPNVEWNNARLAEDFSLEFTPGAETAQGFASFEARAAAGEQMEVSDLEIQNDPVSTGPATVRVRSDQGSRELTLTPGMARVLLAEGPTEALRIEVSDALRGTRLTVMRPVAHGAFGGVQGIVRAGPGPCSDPEGS